MFHSIENIINEKNVDSKNCNENILQHPVKHLPKPDSSYILPNKQVGNIQPMENTHISSKHSNILLTKD